MAKRARPVTMGLTGWAAAVVLLTLTFGTLLAVGLRASGGFEVSAYDLSILRFTVVQALVSAAISAGLAIPVARALSRQRFPGRALLVTIMGAPFILPSIVAILGLTAVFGRSGLLNTFLSALGFPTIDIYGFHGVVLAHVFFNLPLATRMLLIGWQSIPGEQMRLAATLSFSNKDIVQHLERPMLRSSLPGIFALIFLVCVTSFAVALTLGGGPRSTTLEVAIYQAFRFDFDLGRAATLATLQFGVCAVAAFLVLRFPSFVVNQAGLDRAFRGLWPTDTKLTDALWIALAAAFLILPMTLVIWGGASAIGHLDGVVGLAILRSLAVSVVAVTVAVVLALALSTAIVRTSNWQAQFLELQGYFVIASSPIVIGTGLFLILVSVTSPTDWALPITALINGVMALPFCLRILLPQVREVENTFGPVADSLGLNGFNRFRWLLLPRIRPSLGFAAGLAGAFAMGDLGVVALFSDPNATTLPMTIYRLMASYQMAEAQAAAVVLLLLSLGIFWSADQWGKSRAIH